MSFDPKRALPKPGTRFVLPALHGAADACVFDVVAEGVAEARARNLSFAARDLLLPDGTGLQRKPFLSSEVRQTRGRAHLLNPLHFLVRGSADRL
mgnify:CR=1 FL=1